MKTILIILATLLTSSAFAKLDCKAKDLHPKVEAACLFMDVIAKGKNEAINKLIADYTAEGLQASGEYGGALVGGSCNSSGSCRWRYVMTTDYYSFTTFKSLIVIIEASEDATAPELIKVMDPTTF